MRVLLKSCDQGASTRCGVCGAGFVVFWDKQSPQERTEMLGVIDTALRGHHSGRGEPHPHPSHGFMVPEWVGPAGPARAPLPRGVFRGRRPLQPGSPAHSVKNRPRGDRAGS